MDAAPAPTEPVSRRLGYQAAWAMPICSLACATRRSADAMSGRRCRRVEGTDSGMSGTVTGQDGSAGMEKFAGAWPTSTAMACSSCARRRSSVSSSARAVAS